VALIPLLERISKSVVDAQRLKHDMAIRMLQGGQLIIFNVIGATSDATVFNVPHLVPSPALALSTKETNEREVSTGLSSLSDLSSKLGPMGVSRRFASRLIDLATEPVNEEEFIKTTTDQSTLAVYFAFKARVLYMHDRLDDANVAIQRAVPLRPFIATLGAEMVTVHASAMILLGLIGRLEVSVKIATLIVLIALHNCASSFPCCRRKGPKQLQQ
jgi:hypothetical protein